MAQQSDRDANRALKERFAQVHDQYSRLRTGMGELQTKLASLRSSAKTADGLIKATVDARGRLVHLELHPSSMREYGAVKLAEEITRTVSRAAEAAGAGVTALMSQVLPAESGAMEFLRTNDINAMMRRHDGIMGYEPEQPEDGRR